jgi:hypothetical protein
MWTLDRFPKRSPAIAPARGILLALLFTALSIPCLEGQTAPDKAGSSTPSSFAIESEMLTYRALESNSEAIACDIAAYLNRVSANFKNPPPGTVCDVKTGKSKSTVILLAFDNSQFANFQIWRADMATMDRLQAKAAELDCPTNATRGALATAGSLLSSTPAGPPLAVAQSVLALMASEESVSSLVGTVQDQAFMNGVGRELGSLGVTVLMPAAYSPFSLAPLDRADSPFLASLDRTLAARECLADLAGMKDDTKNKRRITQTLSDVDVFLAVLESTASTPGANATSSTPAPVPPPTPGAAATDKKPQEKSTAALSSASHLDAVLSADGLAQKLGVEAATGALPDGGKSQHILLVKALESGGAVTRRGNALGTTVRYSGGSVGTYALFKADGELECSGNVYDYAGSIESKQFQRDLRNFKPEPGKQVIFQRGGCGASAAR